MVVKIRYRYKFKIMYKYFIKNSIRYQFEDMKKDLNKWKIRLCTIIGIIECYKFFFKLIKSFLIFLIKFFKQFLWNQISRFKYTYGRVNGYKWLIVFEEED